MRVKIYCGPELAESVRTVLPEAELAPPIKRGDVHRDLAAAVNVVGIVDGDVLEAVSVASTEILDAIRVGVRVFGAGGLGAIRAAELDRLGMTGCGLVYDHVRANPYFRDDALGLVHFSGPDASSTISLVELELTIERLVASKKLAVGAARGLLRRFRDLHFSQRTFDRLHADLESRSRAAELDALAQVRKHHVSQKGRDAVAMAKLIRAELALVAKHNRQLNGA